MSRGGKRRAALAGLGAAVCLAWGAAAAQQLAQRTDFRSGASVPPRLDTSGATLVFASSGDLAGANPSHAWQLFLFDLAGSRLEQLTRDAANGALAASVSDDGQRIAFASRGDLAGGNHDRNVEIFVVERDGTGLRQLTFSTVGSNQFPVISGDGSRIVFTSTADLTGGNPDLSREVFVVDWDGTNLRQLTDSTGDSLDAHISDDGQRIVFASAQDLTGANAEGNFEIFAVLADGTNLRQLTSAASGASRAPWIAGQGSRIAFQSSADLTGGNPDGGDEIFAIEWDGTGLRQLTNSRISIFEDAVSQAPSMDDAGTVVLFHSNQVSGLTNLDANFEIWKIGTGGTGLRAVTSSALTPGSFFPAASGDGARVGFVSFADFTGGNGDGNAEIFTSRTDGTDRQQVTATVWGLHGATAISANGALMAFATSSDLAGGNPEGNAELFVAESSGAGLRQLTDAASGSAAEPDLDSAGRRVVFSSTANYTGQNPDASREIFAMFTDGTGLRQLTDAFAADSSAPAISADGEWIAFESEADLAGQNPEGNREIFLVRFDGTDLRQLTQSASGDSRRPSVSADGARIAFDSDADLAGGNPDASREIFVVGRDGSGLRQLTSAPAGTSQAPSLRPDGQELAFQSDADLAGRNADANTEIFLAAADGTNLRQLTDTAAGDNTQPRYSEAGTITFLSSAPFAGPNPDGIFDVWQIGADGTGLRRLTAIPLGSAGRPSASGDARRVAFSAAGDPTGDNRDLFPESFLADLAAPWVLRAESREPTLWRWDAAAGAKRYDVARGDLAHLALAGDTVDLGPLVCIEEDSPDRDTAGFEDPELPPPGEAFFYLVRADDGLAPPSYGTDAQGRPRVPGPGDCTP